MNDLRTAATAAAKELAAPARPRFELLEKFYSTPHCDRDGEWQQLKQDERLLTVFRWLAVPSLWASIPSYLDIAEVRSELGELLASSESELPLVTAKAKRLLDFIAKRENETRWP